jgi:hypothetical protein
MSKSKDGELPLFGLPYAFPGSAPGHPVTFRHAPTAHRDPNLGRHHLKVRGRFEGQVMFYKLADQFVASAMLYLSIIFTRWSL